MTVKVKVLELLQVSEAARITQLKIQKMASKNGENGKINVAVASRSILRDINGKLYFTLEYFL